MKKKLLFTAFCAAGLALGASAGVILTDEVEYTQSTAPAAVKAMLHKDQSIEFSIQEDSTTGFVWAATYDKDRCEVLVEHKPAESTMGITKPGKAKIKIVSLTDKAFTVELDCSKPWERKDNKGKIVKCEFNLADSAEFKSPQEDGGGVSIPEDASYSQLEVPVNGIVNVGVRKDVKFKIEEDVASNMIWSLTQCDPAMAKVEIEHNVGKLGMKDKAEIEIKGLKAGYTILKFAYGNPSVSPFVPRRMITCFVIIQ